jgi:hypothetical protein
MLKALVPAGMKPALRRMERDLSGWKDQWHLDAVRTRAFKANPGVLLPCGPYSVRINDGLNFFMQYKDIFVNHIYRFETTSAGRSRLRRKHRHVGAVLQTPLSRRAHHDVRAGPVCL